MKREEVFKAIETERQFQEILVGDENNPDMIEDFHVGDALSAIEVNIQRARFEWYTGSIPHKEATEYLRKIAALCVQIGEKYGMPSRKQEDLNKRLKK